jgi:hypothetical protein
MSGQVKLTGVWDRVDFRDAHSNLAVIKEYKKALSEWQIRQAKSNLQLHIYAWAFEAVFGFSPKQVLLQEIGSPNAAVFTPTTAVVDKVSSMKVLATFCVRFLTVV